MNQEMVMKKRLIAYGLSMVLLLAGMAAPAFAHHDDKKLADPLVDLTVLLAPPPAQDSEQTRVDIQELKKYQTTRTQAQVAYAQADVDKNVFRFQNVLGEKFTPENLPLTAALFEKALSKTKATADPAKYFFNRARPYTYDSSLKPAVALDPTPSYPSGHATAGTVMAILLANMVPEKKAEIFKRGWEYAQNRLVGGVHYRSDIEAGRISGTVIAAFLLKDKEFSKDFAAAKAELRTVLGD
jgi:acid phosphatase (class A)